jgi:AraC-like DNA-binding protein
MSDISVLYLSQVTILPGMGRRAHTHDYWHFSLRLEGRYEKSTRTGAFCVCQPEGEVAKSSVCVETSRYINVMFQVHNKDFARRLKTFPFPALQEEELHIPLLQDILEQARTCNPSQNLIDFAFGYYLLRLMETPHMASTPIPHPDNLADLALEYIETHYMEPIRLNDVAAYIGRTPQHTSYLVKAATGTTVVEHIRDIRIRNACRQLAYTGIPIEEIISSCGFSSPGYFQRVFREKMGTTANRYRTSHAVRDTFYRGEECALDVPFDRPVFTYIPGARRCVSWETPRAYFHQTAPD